MPIITINSEKKAEIDKKITKEAADKWFGEQVSLGYTTPEGWKLGLSESDVTLLTGAFVLAKEASNNNLPLPPIVDTNGTPHYLDLSQMTNLMLSYGQYRANLSAEYANRLPS